MAMWILIIKNNSGFTQIIEDMGIEIANASQITFSDQFTYPEMAESDDLRNLVNNGDLVVNDGVSDLSAPVGVEYLTLYNITKAKDDFYTKTDLQTGGSSSIHWNNITNTPSFGADTWVSGVLARALIIQSAQPTGVAGDFFIDSDDNHLYKHNGISWVDQGIPVEGNRIINLDSTAEVIYTYTSGVWTAGADPVNNTGVLINDDGDGKQAQYVYNSSTLSWVKIADVDFGEPNTLDGAYDEGGPGAGRTINSDSGAVKLDTGVSTNAPIELTEKASLPTTGLGAGQLAVKNGILFIYDSARSKWLSVERMYLIFGRKGKTSNQYLDFGGGKLPSNNSGLRIPRDATIVAMSAQLDANGTSNFRIRKNDNSTNIETLLVNAALGAHSTTLNTDINAADFLQCYSDNASKVSDPMIIVEIAYRA